MTKYNEDLAKIVTRMIDFDDMLHVEQAWIGIAETLSNSEVDRDFETNIVINSLYEYHSKVQKYFNELLDKMRYLIN